MGYSLQKRVKNNDLVKKACQHLTVNCSKNYDTEHFGGSVLQYLIILASETGLQKTLRARMTSQQITDVVGINC
jgi:hypothetical protein